LFGRLVGAKRTRLPLPVPLFDGGRQPMQTIHLDDLLEGFRRAIAIDAAGSLTLASPEQISTRAFFQAVGNFTGRTAVFVDLPLRPALRALRLLESLRVPIPVSSENLLGLSTLKYWDSTPDLAVLDLRVRTLAESLASFVKP
jgi:nucleoside-diphosphate-sugar epimerase